MTTSTPTESVRDELARRLPWWIQWLVSLVSGAVPSGATPKLVWTRPRLYAATMLWLTLGVAATGTVLCFDITGTALWWLLVGMTTVVTVGAERAIQTTLLHDCVHSYKDHQCVYGKHSKGFYYYAGVTLSWLLQAQRFMGYFVDHMAHHGKRFGRPNDPDYQFLLTLGFYAGMKRWKAWARFAWLMVSPGFHLRFLHLRFRSNTETMAQTAATGAYWALVLGAVELTSWTAVFWAWLFPTFLLLHCCALAQFTSEHRWGKRRSPNAPAAFEDAKLTDGRFCADPPPPKGMPMFSSMMAWFWWWTRLLTVHALCRFAIVPFELTHHDMHHVDVEGRLKAMDVELPTWCNWMNYAYVRSLYVRHRGENDPPLTEVWGLHRALDATFKNYESLNVVSASSIEPGSLGLNPA